MPTYTMDHVHLRSPDPDAAGRWYEDMLGARQTARTESRVSLDLGGLAVFIERTPDTTPTLPPAPFQGIEHLALSVAGGLDAAVEELCAKGVRIVTEPKNPRPGVRIAFIEGPERVLIELLERTPA